MFLSLHKQHFVAAHFQFITAHFVFRYTFKMPLDCIADYRRHLEVGTYQEFC